METKLWNNKAKLEESNVLIDSTGTRGANLEDKCFSHVFLVHSFAVLETVSVELVTETVSTNYQPQGQ